VIVARGLGLGGNDIVVTSGLGRFKSEAPGKPRRLPAPPPGPADFDERDLLEIVPAIIGALNAQRTH
jgi:hypothetical protein